MARTLKLLALFLCASTVLCFKRSFHMMAPDALQADDCKKAKVEPELVQESLPAFLPFDILVEIFSHLLGDLRLRRSFDDPMHPSFQVSKYWNSQLNYKEFIKFLLGHPKYANLCLKVSFDLSRPKGLDLLKAASPIIDIPAAMKLLFKARTSNQIHELGKIPIFKRPISYTTLCEQLSYGRRHKALRRIVPDMNDDLFDFDPRDCIIDFLQSKSRLVLHKIPALEIVKIMFLEDLYDPDHFSQIYEFACWQIFRAYRKNVSYFAAPLVTALRGLRLPKSGLEALTCVMSYQMIHAAILGDREFWEFLSVDPELCDPKEFCGPEVVAILKQFLSGEIDCYPANKLTLVKEALVDALYFGIYSYTAKQFKPRIKEILDDPEVSAENKKIARKYLPNYL